MCLGVTKNAGHYLQTRQILLSLYAAHASFGHARD